MSSSFVAVDVETANPNLASICQIGIVSFEDGKPRSSWESLVNPEDFFDPWSVAIHGITEDQVCNAPVFSQVFPTLQRLLADQIVVSHMPFDKLALQRASEKYGQPSPNCFWLDSARVVRRAWPQFARSGYALAKCTQELGITFEHHVAVEDARAAGQLVALAIQETGTPLQDWLARVSYHPHSGWLDEGPSKGASHP